MSATWHKTRDNLPAVIFATDLTKKRCYIGAYQSGEEWYPTTWCNDGRWHEDLGHPRGIDLMLGEHETTVGKS
jgi:hypothetical protein